MVKAVADRLANDIDAGAAPTLYCISEPIPPGSYVGVDGRIGLTGGPVADRPQRTPVTTPPPDGCGSSPKKQPGQRFPFSTVGGSTRDGEHPPFAGHTLELVGAAVLELES